MNCRPPLDPHHALRRWANLIRGHYGHPVYLCGSWVKGKENPRDIDIICIIPDEEFEMRYGPVKDWEEEGRTGIWTEGRWKWADDCAKKWRHGQQFIQNRGTIDFKVLPQSHHDASGEKDRVYQLDTRDEPIQQQH